MERAFYDNAKPVIPAWISRKCEHCDRKISGDDQVYPRLRKISPLLCQDSTVCICTAKLKFNLKKGEFWKVSGLRGISPGFS